jgi:hypothetical protein
LRAAHAPLERPNRRALDLARAGFHRPRLDPAADRGARDQELAACAAQQLELSALGRSLQGVATDAELGQCLIDVEQRIAGFAIVGQNRSKRLERLGVLPLSGGQQRQRRLD